MSRPRPHHRARILGARRELFRHPALSTAPGTKPAGSSKPRQVTPSGTPPREPETAVPATAAAQPPPSATPLKPAIAQKADGKKTEYAPPPAPKSTWWSALTRPFTIPASSLASAFVGPYEDAAAAPAPAPHGRRYSMAVLDHQRAPGRSNVKVKRAPRVSDDLKDFAEVVGDAVGVTGGPPAGGPLATGHTGRPAPEQNGSVEDYLDYDYFQRLQLESEGSEFLTPPPQASAVQFIRPVRQVPHPGHLGQRSNQSADLHLPPRTDPDQERTGAQCNEDVRHVQYFYRKLLCVIDSRYFSPKRRYALKLLPTTYCSEIIFSAVYVNIGTETTVDHKRLIDVNILKDLIYLKQTRTHRGDKLRLHITLGGERKDSPNFVETLEKYEVRDAVLEGLYNSSDFIDGVNVHWDRPGDECDQEFTPAYFRAFLEALYLRNMGIILTVPPVLGLVRNFWLISVTRYVDYVIVTTHLLRRQPNKTSYDHVCRMPKGVFDGDSECVYAIRHTGTGGAELALYAGPEELATRMRKSYASKIGDTTVAVYDMYLDDFGGNCIFAGGPTTTLSPLLNSASLRR
ncbi:hypothetical protein MTO96_041407 [Rhipicephalus appendiculatus]